MLGASPKDTLVAQGPWRLYHYHPRVDEVYRVPVPAIWAVAATAVLFTVYTPVYDTIAAVCTVMEE